MELNSCVGMLTLNLTYSITDYSRLAPVANPVESGFVVHCSDLTHQVISRPFMKCIRHVRAGKTHADVMPGIAKADKAVI